MGFLETVDRARAFLERNRDVVGAPGGTGHAVSSPTGRPARQLPMILPALDAAALFTGPGDVMRNGVPDRDALDRFVARWEAGFLGSPRPVG